ncbi:class II fructose-bisphosphate aldolase [Actinomadura graeca]|uniref:Class II fructose-bisphosphate aldolase n=1 Tax=Actinomadura graeca TaxID=2750812 RepID=A0ABX8R3H7_9ACTN|nr:class II fructose-bisphosphate aldolase [Actinomadura graeca]QXJ24252.1 class II fructose-bisphosphate aldolase [Actinomadura graeca]
MPLVGTGEIIAGGPGVGAFNAVLLEHATAIAAGAEAAAAPVILQISENTVKYHGAAAPVVAAALATARRAAVPVAVHLDHATSIDLVYEAVELGVGSVMFDASTLPYDDNVAATAEVARWCHIRGVLVEGELGEVGGKDGAHAPGARTDPAQAAAYVAATGVDALAVAAGTSHGMITRDAVLDLALISELRDAVPVPLVLHGSSGVPDETLAAAVRHGLTKVNIATRLNAVLTAEIRRALGDAPGLVDPRRYLGSARTAVSQEVARLLEVLRGGILGDN